MVCCLSPTGAPIARLLKRLDRDQHSQCILKAVFQLAREYGNSLSTVSWTWILRVLLTLSRYQMCRGALSFNYRCFVLLRRGTVCIDVSDNVPSSFVYRYQLCVVSEFAFVVWTVSNMYSLIFSYSLQLAESLPIDTTPSLEDIQQFNEADQATQRALQARIDAAQQSSVMSPVMDRRSSLFGWWLGSSSPPSTSKQDALHVITPPPLVHLQNLLEEFSLSFAEFVPEPGTSARAVTAVAAAQASFAQLGMYDCNA